MQNYFKIYFMCVLPLKGVTCLLPLKFLKLQDMSSAVNFVLYFFSSTKSEGVAKFRLNYNVVSASKQTKIYVILYDTSLCIARPRFHTAGTEDSVLNLGRLK